MNIVIPAVNWSAIGPELILSLTAMALLLINVLAKKGAKGVLEFRKKYAKQLKAKRI